VLISSIQGRETFLHVR